MPTNRRSLKKQIIVCKECDLDVNEEEEDSIECDKCSGTYHTLCTTLNKRQYNHLMDNEGEEYVCHKCSNESGGNVKRELNAIKTQLKKLDDMQESMTFMSKQFDELIRGLAENTKKVEAVQRENKILRSEVNELKKTVRFLNDNRVKNDCLISGVEVSGQANAMDTVINVMKMVDINLNTSEFEDAYFIGKNKEAKRKTIVVKFNTKASKQKILSAKRKLNENPATQSVFVNDFLGKETLTLLNHAKSLKAVGYRRVYATGGKVFVKMSELSKPKLLKTADDVDLLLLNATQCTSRRSQGRIIPYQEISDDERTNDDNVSIT